MARPSMASSPRLAFFIPTLAGGGAERVIITLANAFARADFPVLLILTSRQGPLVDAIGPAVAAVSLDGPSTVRSIPALVRTLRRWQPDVLVSALFGATVAAYGAVAWLSARGAPCPQLCATVHSPLPRNDATGLRATLLARAARVVLRRTDTVVAVSESVAQDLTDVVGRPRSHTDVIHNPVDIDAVETAAAASCPHDWLATDAPVVVAAGRLHPQKDYPTLLRALRRLRNHQPVRCLILGRGPERHSIHKLIRALNLEDAVALPGFVDNPYAFMRHSDAFVLSSRTEPFGIVLVEALACGTPVVATDAGGPREILTTPDTAYGPLVPPGRPAELAEALDDTLTSPPEPTQLRRRARAFDVSTIIPQYQALFARMQPHD